MQRILTKRQRLLTLSPCQIEREPAPEVLEATDPRQLKALAHPLRNRIVFALGAEGATVSQLAKSLSTNKGNAAHHLAVLEQAGLVRRGERRQVRGGRSSTSCAPPVG